MNNTCFEGSVVAPLTCLALMTAVLWSFTANAEVGERRQIALSFDDAPLGDGPVFTGNERTRELVAALGRADVEGALFFVTTRNLAEQGDPGHERLRHYAAAGHRIANHSHSHASANRTRAAEFLADLDHADRALRELPGFTPYFRFPYLHEGRPASRRDAIREGLAERGLRNGYVTVDNYDWYMQVLADEVAAAGGRVDTPAWRDAYVDTLLHAVEFYDALAVRSLGRSPRHVLLLHENDLAALFVDDLVAALRNSGWELIPAEAAYADPLNEREPDTLLLNQGRVAAIAHAGGASARRLVSAFEDEAALRAEFVRRGLLDANRDAYLGQPPPGEEPVVFAPGDVSRDGQFEYGSAFSADGLEMFFGVNVGERAEIRTTRFDDGQWTEPAVVLGHPVFTFGDPLLSLDGSRLFFISDKSRDGGSEPGDFDIWYVNRLESGWSEPVNLGSPVNTAGNEYYVSFTDDGHIAYASNHGRNRSGDYDLYLAAPRDDGGFHPPERLPVTVNSGAYEADPFVARDGSYVIFGGSRRDGLGRGDLYIAFRGDDGQWREAVSMGPVINSEHHELCPFVSRDGRYFFYTSDEDIRWVSASIIERFRPQPWNAPARTQGLRRRAATSR